MELGGLELDVIEGDPDPNLIVASFDGSNHGFFELTVATGEGPHQFGAFDIVIGDNTAEPEIGWRSLMANSGGTVLYWEVIEDYTLDLKEYFTEAASGKLPATIGENRRKALLELLEEWPEVKWAFIEVEAGGVLTIKKGYRWDGPSVPSWYKKRKYNRLNRATCVHDALYDLMRLGLLPLEPNLRNNRTIADCMFFVIAREDGMWLTDANWAYNLIRIGGGIKIRSTRELPPWKYHALASAGQVIDCAPPSGIDVELDASSSRFANSYRWRDNGEIIPDTNNDPWPTVNLTEGTHIISLKVSDAIDDPEPNESESKLIITVNVDSEPPTIHSVMATPKILRPPNHKMVEVTVKVDAVDTCDPNPVSQIVDVTCNEPINGIGDGHTKPDWEITSDLTVNLRAERSGRGTGRVYIIHIECTDASGNIATSTVDVTVPHRKHKGKRKK
ncbi:MAG: DUF1353 domain-containing protein [Planctomycetota bacterium]